MGGGKEDVISDGKWDFRPTSGYDVATEIPKKGFIRVTAGKTCDVTLSIVCEVIIKIFTLLKMVMLQINRR